MALIKVILTLAGLNIANGNTEPQILLACLGLAEQRAVTSSIASLLSSRGHHVALFTYGGGGAGGGEGGGGGGGSLEVHELPLAEGDPFFSPIGQTRRLLVPSQRDSSLYDVISVADEEPANHSASESQESQPANDSPPQSYDAIMTSSLRSRCKQILEAPTWTKDQISRAKIFATPLHFHDLCTLTLASQFDLPVVGIVTSPTGSWWSWYHLDLLPSLATFALPPNIMSANCGFLERLGNIVNFYRYLNKMNSDWAEPLITSLPDTTFEPIKTLYSRVGAVIVGFDWLLFPELPVTPFVTPMAGARWGEEQELEEDLLDATLSNRNGVIVSSLIMDEIWVGAAAQDAILDVLAATPFTVVWRGVGKARGGVEKRNKTRGGAATGKTAAILIQKEELPMRALLSHPRHRLLLSLCGLIEVSLAMVYGAPILCLPVTPDQKLTADRLAGLGIAEVVPASEVTPANIREAVRNLTTNRSYRARGRQVAEDILDDPLPSADRVVFVVEKIMRRPWRYKRRLSHGLSLLAQSNGDVMAAILVLVTSLAGVAVWVIFVIVREAAKKRKEKRKEE